MTLWRAIRSSAAFWAAIVAMLAALFFTSGLVIMLAVNRHFAYFGSQGIRTSAEVIETFYSPDGDLWYCRYVYTDRWGGKHEELYFGSYSLTLEEGRRLLIAYDPEDPSRSVALEEVLRVRFVVRWAGSAFAIVIVLFWGLTIVRFWRVWSCAELLRHGCAVQGQVVDVSKIVVFGRRKIEYVKYQFLGPDGRTRQGRSPHLPRALHGRFSPRDDITVIYARGSPDRHIVDYLGYRLSAPKDGREPGACATRQVGT